jgi:predicted RND superfamily exporter protein
VKGIWQSAYFRSKRLLPFSLGDVIFARKKSTQEGLQERIGRWHYNIGHFASSKPWTSIMVSLLFVVIFTGGIALLEGSAKMSFLTIHNDFLDNFAPKDHKAYQDYKRLDSSFEAPRFTYINFRSKAKSIIDKSVLLQVTSALKTVEEMQVVFGDAKFSYQELRAKSAEPSSEYGALSLFGSHNFSYSSYLLDVEQRLSEMDDASISSLVLQSLKSDNSSWVVKSSLGSMTHSESKFSARSLTVVYAIRDTDVSGRLTQLADSASRQWELKLLELINGPIQQDLGGTDLSMVVNAERSMVDESVGVLDDGFNTIWIVVVLMMLYCAATVGRAVRGIGLMQVHSQYLAAAFAVVGPLLATFCSYGFSGYIGLKLNNLAIFVPFLVIGMQPFPTAMLC